jgi:uncharacterized protein YbcI
MLLSKIRNECMETKPLETELASYIGKLLRDHFGKGPESVFICFCQPIITIYLKNFMSPMEKVLMDQRQEETIQQTRDILIKTLKPEIRSYVKILTGLEIDEFYYDWSLHNNSGVIVGVGHAALASTIASAEHYEGRELIHREIIDISSQAEKAPEQISSYLLNPRTLIVIRKGILVNIEKEFIRVGYEEILRIAKRTLEKKYLHNNNHFESILKTKIVDVFVDWDFDLDKSIITFILNPSK